MGEEVLEPAHSQLSPGSPSAVSDAVLGTLAVAGEQVLALPAVSRQRVGFGLPERALLFRSHELADRGLEDVAEQVRRVDEVVAGVDVTVVLESDTLAARRTQNAQRRETTQLGGEHAVEELDEHLADVVSHPLVEDRREELAVGD